MDNTHLKILETFDINTLPSLSVAALGALEKFSEEFPPELNISAFGKRPLVVGSVNALTTGRILFRDIDAEFADEGNYKEKLPKVKDIDSVVIISSSGGKHSVEIARYFKERFKSSNFPVWLLTNNERALSQKFIDDNKVIVFPKNREPYTYNTSTYLGMIFSQTKENPEEIYNFIIDNVASRIPDNFDEYDAIYCIIPQKFHLAKDMFLSKFDELFGARISGRVFSFDQTEHAKTVVSSEKELFVSFGEENTTFGTPKRRLYIPLPSNVSYAGMIAIGYFVIGKIQEQHPQYFKENIVLYAKRVSEMFNQDIQPIVE